ncbi:hypothetical protein ACOSP7_012319 [Xanthoceras sorbifolium]
MEIDGTNESGKTTPRINVNGIYLIPVLPKASVQVLSYAPTNWPNPGDNWSWRVGKRVAKSGYFLDRYLYVPKHLCCLDSSPSKKRCFTSKLLVERYIRTTFPGADVKAFFASFNWKIPSKQLSVNGQCQLLPFFFGHIDTDHLLTTALREPSN